MVPRQAYPDTELLGAKCHLDGGSFEVDIVTPSLVTLPSFATKESTPDLTGTCAYNQTTVTQVFTPEAYKLQRSRSCGGTSGNIGASIAGALIGSLVVGAMEANNPTPKEVYSYASEPGPIKIVFPGTATAAPAN